MAVYTEVSNSELSAFIAEYDIGELVSCMGIAEGVENSNYLLTAGSGPYILTLYEKRVCAGDLPFFLELMEHFAKFGLPCPFPIRGRDGEAFRQLCGRPAAIISFLPGSSSELPEIGHCSKVGAILASFHNVGTDFSMSRSNSLSINAWRSLLEKSGKRANEVYPGLTKDLSEQLNSLESLWPVDLPIGIIHADLFPDNVFFRRGRVSGVIDFYFACTDAFAYDLAICVNAWCFEPDFSFNIAKARTMLEAYQQVRKLDANEIDVFPILAKGAAMRFLLTRLYDWLNTSATALVTCKDPMELHAKLSFHTRVSDSRAYGFD